MASHADYGCLRTLARSLRKVCGVDHGCCVFGLPSNASGISCYEALALRCALLDEPTLRAGRSVVVSNRRWRGESAAESPSVVTCKKWSSNCLRPGLFYYFPIAFASAHQQPHTGLNKQ